MEETWRAWRSVSWILRTRNRALAFGLGFGGGIDGFGMGVLDDMTTL